MMVKSPGDQQTRCAPVPAHEERDPENRSVSPTPEYIREKMLDKTIADTFPTSDPPSSLPDPCCDDSFAGEEEQSLQPGLSFKQRDPGKAA